MKVALQTGTFHIRWNYNREAGKTTCIITDDTVQGNPVEVSQGVAKLHHKDNFDKNKARKITLARAIAHFSKADRTSFWQQYHNRKIQVQNQQIFA